MDSKDNYEFTKERIAENGWFGDFLIDTAEKINNSDYKLKNINDILNVDYYNFEENIDKIERVYENQEFCEKINRMRFVKTLKNVPFYIKKKIKKIKHLFYLICILIIIKCMKF